MTDPDSKEALRRAGILMKHAAEAFPLDQHTATGLVAAAAIIVIGSGSDCSKERWMLTCESAYDNIRKALSR